MSELEGQLVAGGDALDAFPDFQPLLRSHGITVSGWEVRRGRQDEFTRTGTGTATIFVNDLSGFLGTGSEFPVHARIDLRGTTVFRGHVDTIDVDVDNAADVSRAAIRCVDAFDLLSGIELVNAYAFPGFSSVRVFGNIPPDEIEDNGDIFYEDGQVDDRMIQALEDIHWPPSLRSIFSGNVNVMESVYSPGTSFMQVLSDAADAEFPSVANLFMGKDGVLKFRGRFARFNPDAYGISRWQAGTGSHVTSGVAQIRELAWTWGRKQVFNSALCYPDTIRHPQKVDLIDQQFVDDTSIEKYGMRSWAAENLITLRHNTNGNTGAEECQLFAQYIIENYSDPVPRVSQIVFRSLSDDDQRAAATWALMTGVEIGDIVELSTDWIGGEHFVEGITISCHELDGTIPDTTVTLDLSPAAHWTVDPF